MGMYNLDAVHGDEQWGPELTASQIREIREDFLQGVLADWPKPQELLADLLLQDSASMEAIFKIFTADSRKIEERAKVFQTIRFLRSRGNDLIEEQIYEGNIRPNSD